MREVPASTRARAATPRAALLGAHGGDGRHEPELFYANFVEYPFHALR